jgi:hypothetical protein
VIPAQPARDTAVNAALRILQRGQVEIRRATQPFTAAGRSYPANSYLIDVAQPYGSFAKALLENQHYPDLHEYPGGPPKRPYDVVAHTLPLLYGFDVDFVHDPVTTAATALAPVPATPWIAAELSGTARRRIAIFHNASPSMDEGWTRWVFDQYKIPFTMIDARDIRAGNLTSRFDAILLPAQSARQIARGPMGPYPDSLKGGLGETGAAALGAFVDAGGTVVALNDASDYAIEALALPVKNVVASVRPSDFYAPGSLLNVELDRSSYLNAGVTAPHSTVWFESSPVFEVTDATRATVAVRYPAAGADPLASGWLLGAPRLAGKGALVEAGAARDGWCCSGSARSTAGRAWRRSRCFGMRYAGTDKRGTRNEERVVGGTSRVIVTLSERSGARAYSTADYSVGRRSARERTCRHTGHARSEPRS